VKLAGTVIVLTVFGWALVAAADSRHEMPEPEVRVVVREVTVEVDAPVVSIVDDEIDWVEVNRQTDCLWRFMVEQELEISFDMVWAAGEVTDALGGACFVIGEDDE
jgi:hypothetical protein